MKRFFRFGLPVIAVVFAFSGFVVTEINAQGILTDYLGRMDRHNKTLSSLRANVTMAKQNAQLGDDPEITLGKAIYVPRKGKDALVRIDWTKPEESLAVVNGKYIIYRPRLKQVLTGSVNKAKGNGKANGALAFMNMSKAQLKQNYKVTYLGEGTLSDGTPTVHLELVPITKASYKKAEIWVDANGMPLQSKITENNNDTTTVLLTKVEKNISLKGADFEIRYPGDTKIVKS